MMMLIEIITVLLVSPKNLDEKPQKKNPHPQASNPVITCSLYILIIPLCQYLEEHPLTLYPPSIINSPLYMLLLIYIYWSYAFSYIHFLFSTDHVWLFIHSVIQLASSAVSVLLHTLLKMVFNFRKNLWTSTWQVSIEQLNNNRLAHTQIAT